jgi:FtsZ-binding cell division protein ZapB
METDRLALLEEKILRAVETVNKLRKERETALAAVAESSALEARISELATELAATRAERDALKADKEAVRQRVEKLLQTIDSLASS